MTPTNHWISRGRNHKSQRALPTNPQPKTSHIGSQITGHMDTPTAHRPAIPDPQIRQLSLLLTSTCTQHSSHRLPIRLHRPPIADRPSNNNPKLPHDSIHKSHFYSQLDYQVRKRPSQFNPGQLSWINVINTRFLPGWPQRRALKHAPSYSARFCPLCILCGFVQEARCPPPRAVSHCGSRHLENPDNSVHEEELGLSPAWVWTVSLRRRGERVKWPKGRLYKPVWGKVLPRAFKGSGKKVQ